MSKKNTAIVLNEKDNKIAEIFANYPDGLTIAQFNEISGLGYVPGNFTSAVRKGVIEVIGETEVKKPGKGKVALYSYIDSDAKFNAAGKPFNYTDSEKSVLAAASSLEGAFTLADLAFAMGVERLTSGNINGLIKKGNLAKLDETREVIREVTSTVNVYALKA